MFLIEEETLKNAKKKRIDNDGYVFFAIMKDTFLLFRVFKGENFVCKLSWTAFFLKLSGRRITEISIPNSRLFQLKWNRNHSIREQKSKVLLNLSPLFQLFLLFQLCQSPTWNRQIREYSSCSTYSQECCFLKSVHFTLAQSGTSIEFRPLSF